MKILFVSKYFPYDLDIMVHGVYKRMRMFIDAIKEIASLDMLIYVPPDLEIPPSLVSELERSYLKHWDVEIKLFLCPTSSFNNEGKLLNKIYYYGSGAFSFLKQSNYLETSGPKQLYVFETCLQRNPDKIFAHRLSSISPILLTTKKLPPVYLDLDDIEHIALKRSTPQMKKWYSRLINYSKLPALLYGERRAILLAQKTFVCSESDQQYLTNRFGLDGVVTIPNAVTLPGRQPVTQKPTILFIGSYNYRPNIEAVEFLIEKIWPLVYKKMPTAQLIIAGAPPDRICGYSHVIPGVKFTGFVKDIEELYRQSRVFCAPMLSGAGTNIKIIEAAAYGKPIVTTEIGAQGLELRDGHELLVHNNPESLAETCVHLLKDTILCKQLGSAANTRAIQFYDRNKIVQLIKKHLKN